MVTSELSVTSCDFLMMVQECWMMVAFIWYQPFIWFSTSNFTLCGEMMMPDWGLVWRVCRWQPLPRISVDFRPASHLILWALLNSSSKEKPGEKKPYLNRCPEESWTIYIIFFPKPLGTFVHSTNSRYACYHEALGIFLISPLVSW